MPRFDPTKSLLEFDVLADFTRVNRLDDLWTSYLRVPGPVPALEADALARIPEEMGGRLGRIRDHAGYLRNIIDKSRDDFDLAFANTLAATLLFPIQREAIEQVVREAGGFARFAISQLTVLVDESGEEEERLRKKMTRIREGGITAGD